MKKELSALFDELVPSFGKAESKAGEIVRATNRIIYRWFNDGDKIGLDYGKETCNAPARFLMMEGGMIISDVVSRLWGLYDDEEYEMYLDDLGDAVIEFLKEHPELRNEHTEDMYNYREPEDLEWDDDEDEEDYNEEEEDDEDTDF